MQLRLAAALKRSAAFAASANPANQGISDAKDGLIQIVADNFDSDISSQNGKLSTHSMAMIVMSQLLIITMYNVKAFLV